MFHSDDILRWLSTFHETLYQCFSIIIVFIPITILRDKNFAIHTLEYKTEVCRCWITHPRLCYNKCWDQDLNFSKFGSETTLSNTVLYLDYLTVPQNILNTQNFFYYVCSMAQGKILLNPFLKFKIKQIMSFRTEKVTQARMEVGVIKPGFWPQVSFSSSCPNLRPSQAGLISLSSPI